MNSAGNTILLVMLAIGALGASTYQVMQELQTAKTSAKGIRIKGDQELIEYRIKALMSSTAICTENFGTKMPDNNNIDELTRNNQPFLVEGLTYAGGAIKIINIRTSRVTDTEYKLHIDYDKKIAGAKRPQRVEKFFTLSGSLNGGAGTAINNCYLNDENETEIAINEGMMRVCNGPGVVSTDSSQCKIVNYSEDSLTNCNPGGAASGQSIGSYNIDPATGSIEFSCEPIINPSAGAVAGTSPAGTGTMSPTGGSTMLAADAGGSDGQNQSMNNSEGGAGSAIAAGTNCAFGMTYTQTPGEFDCFDITDIIDESAPVQTVQEGADCSIIKEHLAVSTV